MLSSKSHPSRTVRRGLVGLGVVGVGAALTMAAAPQAHAADGLTFSCKATVFGTTMDQGTWTAVVTTDAPDSVKVNEKMSAPKITAKVTTSTSAADTLRTLGITSVDGSSKADYTVSGAVVNPGTRTGDLTIGSTKVPSSGGLSTTATGSGQPDTAGADTGQIKVSVGNFTADIQTYQGDTKSLVIPVKCTLDSGQDPVIKTIQVTPDVMTGSGTDTRTTNLLTAGGIGIAVLGVAAAGGAVSFGRKRHQN